MFLMRPIISRLVYLTPYVILDRDTVLLLILFTFYEHFKSEKKNYNSIKYHDFPKLKARIIPQLHIWLPLFLNSNFIIT